MITVHTQLLYSSYFDLFLACRLWGNLRAMSLLSGGAVLNFRQFACSCCVGTIFSIQVAFLVSDNDSGGLW